MGLGLLAAASAWVGFLLVGPLSGGWHVTRQVTAPEGRSYRLVVAEASDLGHYWGLSIRRGHGITTREWNFGCFNDDSGEGEGLYSADWDGPNRIVVTKGFTYEHEPSGTTVVTVNDDGRPQSRVDAQDWCAD